MIIGGLQTGNTRWLAAHLQNAADNETIEIAEVRGTIARDVDGALVEFDAYTKGTRATEGVYAAFINPPRPLTRAQYMQAITVIEDRLGLPGQPRIIVFHVKRDKSGKLGEHCHVVWSRIDTQALKAIHLAHDRQKLRRCARELAAAFGTDLPPNLAHDRGIARFEDPPQPTRAERAMEAASGLSREERRRRITDCYRLTDTAQAFANSLEAAGFMLARGDRRCFVVVDSAGDVHSLARQIDGAKTKDVKKKLEGLTLSLLPPVDRAKVLMLQRAAARADVRREDEKKKAADKAARERLKQVQRKRRAALDLLWQQMKVRQWHEWKVLLAHIRAKQEHKIARRHWLAVGLALYIKKIAFIRQLIEYYEKRRKRRVEEEYAALMKGVRRRHDNEAAELKRRYAALERLERRELAIFTQKFGDVTDTDDCTPKPASVTAVSTTVQSTLTPLWTTRIASNEPPSIPISLHHDYYRNLLDVTRPYSGAEGNTAAASFCFTDQAAFRQNAYDVTTLILTAPLPAEDSSARGHPEDHAPVAASPFPIG